MFLAAVLRAGGEQAPVKVRNMSRNGALLDSPLMPSRGTKVQLVRGSLIADGTVAWSSDGRCGLSFVSQVTVKDWLLSPTKAEQQRVDEIVSLVKAGAIPTAFAGTESPDRAVSKELVEDALEDVLTLLQDLEINLASSHESLARHGPKLQNLDVAMQMIRAVMRTTVADGFPSENAGADLENLRAVCAQALGKRQE